MGPLIGIIKIACKHINPGDRACVFQQVALPWRSDSGGGGVLELASLLLSCDSLKRLEHAVLDHQWKTDSAQCNRNQAAYSNNSNSRKDCKARECHWVERGCLQEPVHHSRLSQRAMETLAQG